MAYMCRKPKGSRCHDGCPHYRRNDELYSEHEYVCWVKEDVMKLIGKEIMIVDMQGEPSYNGRIGRVESVDSMTQMHGTWGGLAVEPTADKYEVLEANVKTRKRGK